MHGPNQQLEEPLWIFPKQDEELKKEIIREFRLHPVTAQILVSRGFSKLESINHLLYAQLPDLHDPYLLVGMEQAVRRIVQAVDNQEPILVYGDNDVDGMTGAVLLTEFLQKIGAKAFAYLSNRSILRHKLYVNALEYALQHGCKLMITVDCGITAATEIAQVVEQGVDVIVTDHHEPTDQIPLCVATLNPKLVNNTYPNRELTGAGVAFKLVHAVMNHFAQEGRISADKIDLKQFLDLVALGTVSDMGALVDENRILVRYGLKQLRRSKRVGLLRLMEICEISDQDLTTFDIASKIAPRLNSLGRIDDPQKGVELLMLKNTESAERLAQELDLNNIERQRIERAMSKDVETTIADNPSILQRRAIVMYSDKWHPGIVAIVCTRISKLYNRPTVMIAIEGDVGKASLRSIREFPLLTVLKNNAYALLNFGGHDYAAGLTIQREDIEGFAHRFVEAVEAHLKEEDIMSKLYLDAEVNFSELTFDFMESIRLLEPFGNENPAPVLYCDVKQTWSPKIVGRDHLRMYLEQGDRVLEGVAFGKAHLAPLLKKKNLELRIAFTPQVSMFQNKSSIQLLIKDFQIINEKPDQPDAT